MLLPCDTAGIAGACTRMFSGQPVHIEGGADRDEDHPEHCQTSEVGPKAAQVEGPRLKVLPIDEPHEDGDPICKGGGVYDGPSTCWGSLLDFLSMAIALPDNQVPLKLHATHGTNDAIIVACAGLGS